MQATGQEGGGVQVAEHLGARRRGGQATSQPTEPYQQARLAGATSISNKGLYADGNHLYFYFGKQILFLLTPGIR